MSSEAPPWPVRLSAAAEADIQAILVWTLEQFGEAQAEVYADTISAALAALATGPDVFGTKTRGEIAPGLFTLPVARLGHKGRHFIMFRIGQDKNRKAIEVLRVLHDAMDLARHVP